MNRSPLPLLSLGLLLASNWLACAKQTPPVSKQEQSQRESEYDDLFCANMKGPIASFGDPKSHVSDIQWNPNDKHIPGFVAYCAANGVTLRYDKASRYWQVVDAKVQDHSVVVRIRGFPDTAPSNKCAS